MFKKTLKTKIIALFLCLLMLCTCTMIAFTKTARIAYAEEELDEYLTNSDISESDMEDLEYAISEQYSEYIYEDIYGHIGISWNVYDESDRYIMLDEAYDGEIYNMINDDEVFTMEFWTNEYENGVIDDYMLFDVVALKTITRNTDIMNRLVDAELGYINSDWEFVFYETDEYVEQWRVWGFKLSWNKITVNFDADFALIISVIFLLGNIFSISYDATDMLDQLSRFTPDDLKEVFSDAMDVAPFILALEADRLLTDDVIYEFLDIFVACKKILTKGTPVLTVISIVLDVILPSIENNMAVLINTIKYQTGVNFKMCWIPWFGDHFGFSVKTLW